MRYRPLHGRTCESLPFQSIEAQPTPPPRAPINSNGDGPMPRGRGTMARGDGLPRSLTLFAQGAMIASPTGLSGCESEVPGWRGRTVKVASRERPDSSRRIAPAASSVSCRRRRCGAHLLELRFLGHQNETRNHCAEPYVSARRGECVEDWLAFGRSALRSHRAFEPVGRHARHQVHCGASRSERQARQISKSRKRCRHVSQALDVRLHRTWTGLRRRCRLADAPSRRERGQGGPHGAVHRDCSDSSKCAG